MILLFSHVARMAVCRMQTIISVLQPPNANALFRASISINGRARTVTLKGSYIRDFAATRGSHRRAIKPTMTDTSTERTRPGMRRALSRYEAIDQIRLIQLLDPPAQRTSGFIVTPSEVAVSDFAHAGHALGYEFAFGDRPRGKTLRNSAHGHALALCGELRGKRGQSDAFLRGPSRDRTRLQLTRALTNGQDNGRRPRHDRYHAGKGCLRDQRVLHVLSHRRTHHCALQASGEGPAELRAGPRKVLITRRSAEAWERRFEKQAANDDSASDAA